MYRFLKMLLKVAETVGSIEKATMGKSNFTGDYVEIHGKTSDGKTYCLELRVRKDENS